jgi:ABC-type enterochelin transport system ATPase subunit
MRYEIDTIETFSRYYYVEAESAEEAEKLHEQGVSTLEIEDLEHEYIQYIGEVQ